MRPRPSVIRLAAAVVTFVSTACAVPPEQPLLEAFFQQSRLRDPAALQAFATVLFDPDVDGMVTTFRVVQVTAEQRQGDRLSKQVTVQAPVRTRDGVSRERTIQLTLERRASTAPNAWVITGFR